jgi:hypothetical protein
MLVVFLFRNFRRMGKIVNKFGCYIAYEDEHGEHLVVPNNSIQTYAALQLRAVWIGGNIISEYNLPDWHIEVADLQSALGLCDYERKTIMIDKSRFWLLSWEQLKEIILHEVAHALCPGHGHDEVWKAKAIEIGCSGQQFARYNLKKIKDDAYQVLYEG